MESSGYQRVRHLSGVSIVESGIIVIGEILQE